MKEVSGGAGWSAHLPAEPAVGDGDAEKRHGDSGVHQVGRERRERGQQQGG